MSKIGKFIEKEVLVVARMLGAGGNGVEKRGELGNGWKVYLGGSEYFKSRL